MPPWLPSAFLRNTMSCFFMGTHLSTHFGQKCLGVSIFPRIAYNRCVIHVEVPCSLAGIILRHVRVCCTVFQFSCRIQLQALLRSQVINSSFIGCLPSLYHFSLNSLYLSINCLHLNPWFRGCFWGNPNQKKPNHKCTRKLEKIVLKQTNGEM